MEDDLDLIQAFIEESAELAESFEQGLLDLEQTPGDPEVLNRIFRAAHTIKGNSGMLGFTDVMHFTHTLEDVLDRMRKGRLQVTREGMTLLLRSLDMLKLKLQALVRPEETPPDAAQLIAELGRYAEEGSRAISPPVGEPRVSPTATTVPEALTAISAPPRQGANGDRGETPPAGPAPGPAPLEVAETERPRLGEILVQQQVVSPEQLAEALKKQKRVGEILLEQHAVAPEQIARALEIQAAAAPKGDTASIRVQTEKVDRLVNLVGEMVITQSMLGQVASRFTLDQLPRLTEAVAAMERHSRELQERVMAVRMQPIKTVFGRFSRLVRDLAQSLGKEIRLDVSGEETELDKTVIDRIGDPLTHLVRNCVDHGIEAPEVRRQQGKPDQGVVRLHAFHQGGNIFIEVEDDGKGLDRDRIQRKGVENGLVREGESLADEQIYALIFRAGFSTAEIVTDVSGRGVGMDVVQRNITALGGQVAIASVRGAGTKFTIKLPLTLAILDGLSVQIGQETYIIPLVNITESIRPRPGQVQTIVGEGEVVNLRGRVLPILRLYEVLGVTPRVVDPTESLLVIVENGREQVAFLVDELVGQHQVVIKSLESNYQRVEGVSGATILGDGRVALILDVPGLVRMASDSRMMRAA
ncbi:MAG: chemotaxis protein CheA [candidate division NC10 bacterium]|nr:chemotaxis protein CheA [candidate division NC10 bacterium]